MAVLSIIIFFAAIIVAFIFKNNIGVIAMAVGVIAVHLFGLSEKDLISGVSTSLLITLIGITLLFSIITNTGALDLLAHKIVALAGKRIWLLPILVALTGWFLVAIGPGGVPVLAIIPPLAVSIALQVGYDPLMMATIGITGMLSARFSPLTPEGNIILNAVETSGYQGYVNVAIMVNTGITSIIIAVILFFMFGGHKVKAPENMEAMKVTEKFNAKQWMALGGIVALLVLIIGFNACLLCFFLGFESTFGFLLTFSFYRRHLKAPFPVGWFSSAVLVKLSLVSVSCGYFCHMYHSNLKK